MPKTSSGGGLWRSETVHNEYFHGTVDIFRNPSPTLFKKSLLETGHARGNVSIEEAAVYVWFGPALHGDIETPGEIVVAWNEPWKGSCNARFYDSIYDLLCGDTQEDDVEMEDIEKAIRSVAAFRALLGSFNLVIEAA